MKLFDQQAYRIRQKRSLRSFHNHDFLYRHVEGELTSRVQDIKRNFKKSLNFSPHALNICNNHIAFYEDLHDVAELSQDLILSCLSAHWIEDLPGFLSKVHKCLNKEGFFICALLGGNTLFELRESLLDAEISVKGGASPRISPMILPSDATHLLSRVGFILPVVDTEIINVTYTSLFSLMRDLRGMGETNILKERYKSFTSRKIFDRAEEIYRAEFAKENGLLPATFEVIYLTGWKNPQA